MNRVETGGLGGLLARGRAADVFDAGPGRVLRRYREGEHFDTAIEALAMERARSHGFPTPAVYDADGRDLLLERVDGPTMLTDLERRPWRVWHHGRTLARLHASLHKIPAPPELPSRVGRGGVLTHGDLHPDNVLLSRQGPVVIDWSNAAGGDAADDVAMTWVILATSVVAGPRLFRVLARVGRALLIDAFLFSGVIDVDRARERLVAVAERRLRTDPHLLTPERGALEALIAENGKHPGTGTTSKPQGVSRRRTVALDRSPARRKRGIRSFWASLQASQRRWIIVNAFAVTAVLNVIINATIAWATAVTENSVPLWSIPLVAPPSTAVDTLGTLFILPLVTALLATTAVWHDRRTGRLMAFSNPAARPWVMAVAPVTRLRRGLVLGAACLVLIGPPAIALLVGLDFADIPLSQFVLYKAALGVALGALVTPLIALWAMADIANPATTPLPE